MPSDPPRASGSARAITAAPIERERRSRALTYAGMGVVLGVYVLAVTQAARFLPVTESSWPIQGVLWGGIAASCCIAAAILTFSRAFQVTIVARSTQRPTTG